ncbi:MAG: right-handed parallel beta-helix repeat-containing protein, partial [Treponema sp.]|nr:right-handed parallel beta-helix repeat-containing protein [Treponema sp.]
SSSIDIRNLKVSNSMTGISGSSGTVQISNADLSSISGAGINLSSPDSVTINTVTANDIYSSAVSIVGGNGVRTITGVTGNRVGAGISISGGSSVSIKNSELHDITNNHAISVQNISGLVEISGGTITNVSGKSADAVNISSGSGNRLVNNLAINGTGRSGVNIGFSSTPLITISKVAVKNARGSWGISTYTSTGSTTITDSSVEDSHSGVYSYTPDGQTFAMAKSTIKNTGQALGISAWYYEVKNVDFINNLSTDATRRIAEVSGNGIFTGCNFIHDSTMQHKVPNNPDWYHFYSLFDISYRNEGARVIFDFCTFSNLLGYWDNPTYIFCRWSKWFGVSNSPRGNSKSRLNIELKNSIFTFKQGEVVGLFAGYAGTTTTDEDSTDYLLVDNVTIYDHGTLMQLFWLDARRLIDVGSFRFRNNSYYNGSHFTNDALKDFPPNYLRDHVFSLTGFGRPSIVK